MKYLITFVLLSVLTIEAEAQQSHYQRALRPNQDDRYGLVGGTPSFNGSGIYWSRVRDIDDITIIPEESREDSIARNKAFRRLCELAYDAFEDGDYYQTAIYGDSALSKQFFTPELLYFMAVSLEKLECYKKADIAYKKALKAGYPKAVESYAKYQQHMKELKALDKLNKKEAKRKGEKFVSLSEGKSVPEPMDVKREPSLQLLSNSLKLEGQTDDGGIRAGTRCKLYFQLRNNGNAPTGMCKITLGKKNGNDALNIGSIPPVVIKKRETIYVEIPIEADQQLEEGETDLILLVEEPNGFGLPPRNIKVKTHPKDSRIIGTGF